MIVKLLISLILLGIGLFALLHRHVNIFMRSILCSIIALGITVTWLPDSATSVANVMGVGRGADLLFYMWILISMLVILMVYTKFIVMNRTLTKLARHIALANPRYPTDRDSNNE